MHYKAKNKVSSRNVKVSHTVFKSAKAMGKPRNLNIRSVTAVTLLRLFIPVGLVFLPQAFACLFMPPFQNLLKTVLLICLREKKCFKTKNDARVLKIKKLNGLTL